NFISFLQTCNLSRRVCHYAINHSRNIGSKGKQSSCRKHFITNIFRNRDGFFFPILMHYSNMLDTSYQKVIINCSWRSFIWFSVHHQNPVSVLKSQLFKHFVNGIPIGHFFYPIIAPSKKHSDKNHYGHNNIHGNPSKHDDEPLPGRFTAKLPGLWGLSHLLFVHTLVDHSGDFHIPAER